MKNKIIALLHKLIGFNNYLFIFALFIFYKLRWDRNERDFLKIFDLIKEDGIILDIGANIGVMTSHFARRRKNSQVFSFEPIPKNLITLKRVLRHFKLTNVKVIETALSDHKGETEMIMPEIDNALKHGLCHVKDNKDADQAGEIFSVKMTKLDDLEEISNTGKKVTAIKIDVEGHELAVLKGAAKTLKQHKPIIYCELWEGKQRRKTIDFLAEFGYHMYIVKNNELISYIEGEHKNQNFFFI